MRPKSEDSVTHMGGRGGRPRFSEKLTGHMFGRVPKHAPLWHM